MKYSHGYFVALSLSFLAMSGPTQAHLQPLAGVSKVAVGGSHVCAIADGGRLFCWGANADGQLGTGDLASRLSAYPLDFSAGQVKEVAAGTRHTCALLTGGEVRCWGSNAVGQLGNGGTASVNTPSSIVALPSPAVGVFADADSSCAILNSGQLFCWGSNSSGQIEYSGVENYTLPKWVEWADEPVSRISGTWSNICAVYASGEAQCRGSGDFGQLGVGTDHPSPTDNVINPNPPSRFNLVAGGGNHLCSTMTDHRLYCWGNTRDNTLYQPTWVYALLDPVVAPSATNYSICALTLSGVVKCSGWIWDWYNDTTGEDGKGTLWGGLDYMPVVGLQEEVRLIQGEQLTHCAATVAGRLYCWGDNSGGQLGSGSADRELLPVLIPNLHQSTHLSQGYGHACAAGGGAPSRCWGSNLYGELGIDSRMQRLMPSEPLVDVELTMVKSGNNHACGLDFEARAFCWGFNSRGRLGLGEFTGNTSRPLPVALPGAGLRALDLGRFHGCTVTDTREVFCWGDNLTYQLGVATPNWSNQPLLVTGLPPNISTVVSGAGFQCAIAEPGDAYCWGENSTGQLGLPASNPVAAPTRIEGLPAPIRTLAAGTGHACALLADQTVWCWGDNALGQLGLGSTGEPRVATQVLPAEHGVTDISSKHNHTCVLLNSGAVECWGFNGWGRLGDGTEINRSAPTPVAGLVEPATKVIAGHYSTCAKMQSGDWYCWGKNEAGELGNGGAGVRSFADVVMVDADRVDSIFGHGFE
jgi:alpha-tubulin suppressor-like RCC1 family protein